MKLSWYAKEILVVLAVLVLSISLLVWAIVDSSNLQNGFLATVVGFTSGFIPISIEFLAAYRNGTLFLRDKEAVAAKRDRNIQLGKRLLIPGIAFGITFAYFPDAIRIFLLAAGAGYLLPFSIVLTVHFLKNHKEIEKIDRGI